MSMRDNDTDHGGSRRFIYAFFALLLMALTATALFNYRVNPYGYFYGWPLVIDRGNSDWMFSNMRYFKAYDVARYAPEHLVLGSSRAGNGITHVESFVGGLRSYNIALPGMTPYEMLRYLQHSHALHPLKGALLGLDMFTFNRHDQRYRPGYSEERLLTSADGTSGEGHLLRARLRDLTIALLSEDALRSTMKTARASEPVKAGGMRLNDDGSWGKALVDVDSGKAYTRFIKEEDHYVGNGWVGNRSRAFGLYGHDSRLQYYRELLRFAHQQRIDLRMFTSPVHARMLVLMKEVGLWGCFEQWKREMWRINHEVALEMGRTPFPLWDFAGVDEWTSVQLSKQETPSEYTDSSHYSLDMGNRVLERIYRNGEFKFGGLIDGGETLNRRLDLVRNGLRDYIRDTPEQSAELHARTAKFWNSEKGYPEIGSCRLD